MKTVRAGLRCDKPAFDRVGVALKTMMLRRDLLSTSMKTRRKQTALSEGIDEFMTRSDFQALFRNITRSWLKPALTAYASRLRYNNRRRKPASSPQGR